MAFLKPGPVTTLVGLSCIVYALSSSLLIKLLSILCPIGFLYFIRPSPSLPISSNDSDTDDSSSPLTRPSPSRRDLCTDRYSKNKLPSTIDGIVIGSGLSGLSCAALLARSGKKIIVLEQHTITGGGTHSYNLGSGQGYNFDSGMHYLVPESTQLLQFAIGSTDPSIPDCALIGEPPGADGSVIYERVVFQNVDKKNTEEKNEESNTNNKYNENEFQFKLWQKHLPELYARFPDNKADIDAWIQLSEEAVNSIPLYVLSKLFPFSLQKLLAPILLKNFLKHAGKTGEEVILSITKNKKLASILGSLWIDTGSPPHIATFMLSAAVVYGFPIKGGAYPRGGSQTLSSSLIAAIERNGGRVLVRADVKEIIVEGGVARGVRLVGGDEIRAPLVVSSTGYNNTFNKLLSEEITKQFSIPRSLLPPSAGFVMCNIGFRGTAEELGIQCSNTWYLPVDNEGDMYSAIHKHWDNPLGDADNLPLMITWPSLKDRDHVKHHPDRQTCQILAMADGHWFRKWSEQKSGARDAEYMALKKQWETAMLNKLFQLFPKVKPYVDFVDLSTPLSIEYYVRGPEGAACGLDLGPKRFTDWSIQEALDTKTKIPGLYFTGQDTLICGQPLAQLAGLISALRIIGPIDGAKMIAQSIFYENPVL